MKFRNYLETIAGVGIFPLISLLIFFIFFVVLLIQVFRIDKKTLNKMKNIPLDDGNTSKVILSLLLFLFTSIPSFAQETEETKRVFTGTDFILYATLAALTFLLVMILIVLFRAISVLRAMKLNGLPEEESKLVFSKNWWRNFRGIGIALTEEDKILIKGHDYDGIQELDNSMPPWLQSLFLGTIIIGFAYGIYYFGGFGDMQIAELDKEVAMADAAKKAYMEKVGASMDENTVTLLKTADDISKGQTIFTEKCIACHGPEAGGGVGPNLTDDYWLHGGSINSIFKVIKYGVPEKGMISWEKQLSPTDIQKLASFIISKKGSKPANAKEPQGELFEDGATAKKDSTVAAK